MISTLLRKWPAGLVGGAAVIVVGFGVYAGVTFRNEASPEAAAAVISAPLPSGAVGANQPQAGTAWTDTALQGATESKAAAVEPDQIVTAGISPLPPRLVSPWEAPGQPAPPAAKMGSDAFLDALRLVDSKKHEQAFNAAKELDDDVERITVQWAALQGGSSDASVDELDAFAEEAPGLLTASVLKTRFEQALVRSGASDTEIIERLSGENAPTTLGGRIRLAVAYLNTGNKAEAKRLAREVWVENFLDAGTEKQVLKKLGKVLTRDDHWARAVHLLMNDRATGTERLLKYLSSGQQSLAKARIAVARKAKNAKALLDKVDAAYQDHPVYIFSRVQRAVKAKLYDSAAEWLGKVEGPVPDAELWWAERRTVARALMRAGKTKLAYRVADGYAGGPPGRMVEAHFHAGWIALTYLKDAEAARKHFAAMTTHATLPDSVTQANYWLGRSLLALDQKEPAREAFATAAKHTTTYYGLLARTALGLKGAALREMPEWRDAQPGFDNSMAIRAVRLLAASKRQSMAERLLSSYAQHLDNGSELLLAARLAQTLGAHHLAISIAETSERRGFALDLFSFPRDGLPNTAIAAIDKAAVYAITRQESRFQVNAVSSAGARGLMQLMPGTARETAAKVGVEYSKSRLTEDPAYNTLLGSTYLAAQLARYDGSLVLAAAAYNAGGGNANKWIRAYGDPRSDDVDPVVWVELIPFQETRKYVQRVLANYLVYRARLGDQNLTMGEALRYIPD